MLQTLRTITIVIPDYDQAIAWYTGVLGFDLLEDTPQTPTKRWVVVAPPGSAATPGACQFLLARAATPPQTGAIGNQTGGRVAFFLTTNDFTADFQRLTAAGVHFLETPRHEPYGWVVQFADPWGNKYDLLEAPSVAQPSGSYVSNGDSPATKQLPGNRPRRFGFVGILVPHSAGQGPEIQRILSDHADLIQGRMGLPHLENDTLAVITLIIRASPDELGSLTGSLGRLEGVTVKSGLAPLKDED